jgi:hypothetical protein
MIISNNYEMYFLTKKIHKINGDKKNSLEFLISLLLKFFLNYKFHSKLIIEKKEPA